MNKMFGPPHPGAILKDIMGRLSVTALAEHLSVPRTNLSMILNGRLGVSPAVAIKLSQAYPNSDAQFWLNLQNQYDLSQESKKRSKRVKPLAVNEEVLISA